MKIVKLSDRQRDTLQSISQMYAEDLKSNECFRGRKQYKFKAKEFEELADLLKE